MILRRVTLVLALLCAAGPAAAALAPSALSKAEAAPPPDARLPEGLVLTDQTGRPAALGPSSAPTLLIFADYTCRHICGSALTLTAAALEGAGLAPGRDVRFAVVGLDPKDGPAAAQAMADKRLADMPEIARATLLLSGDQEAVGRLERAFGYRAEYDPETDQFAHQAAAFLLTPDGRLSDVLSEIAMTPETLRAKVEAAAAGATTGSPGLVSRAISLCYGFAAAHGLHSQAVIVGLRGAALGFCALMGFAVWRLVRRRAAA